MIVVRYADDTIQAIGQRQSANSSGFHQGRDFGAWLGLVPKQESAGDRTKLGKISKRGNLRTPFVQAAHVVLVRRPAAVMRGLWPWIQCRLRSARSGSIGNSTPCCRHWWTHRS